MRPRVPILTPYLWILGCSSHVIVLDTSFSLYGERGRAGETCHSVDRSIIQPDDPVFRRSSPIARSEYRSTSGAQVLFKHELTREGTDKLVQQHA
jgi:hypothetical protein